MSRTTSALAANSAAQHPYGGICLCTIPKFDSTLKELMKYMFWLLKMKGLGFAKTFRLEFSAHPAKQNANEGSKLFHPH